MKRFKTGAICFMFFLLLMLMIPAAGLYSQVNRGAGVPAQALPDDLKGLTIKDFFVPADLKRVGVIHALEGKVVVVHRATKDAYFGKAGDAIFENDSLNTLADSRCRVRFADEDVVSMAEKTEFSVESFEDRKKESTKRSLFGTVKGKVMFYAMRLFSYRESKFDVKTPTAVVGVRGTKFATHVYRIGGEKRADRGIMVADSGNEIGPYLAQVGPPGTGNTVTDAICFDGTIDVDGVPLEKGQMFQGQTGQVVVAPPQVLSQLEKETEVKTEEEKKKEEEEKKAEERVVTPTPTTEEKPAQETTAEQSETQSQVVQQQTGSSSTETITTPTQDRPKTHIGYFSGMIVNKHPSSGDYLAHVFSSQSRQDFDSSEVTAESVKSPSTEYIKAQGGSPVYQNPYAKRAMFTDGMTPKDSGVLGLTHKIDHVEINHNSYQAWGYWTMTTVMTIGSDSYYFDNKGYYIYGDNTPDAAMSGFSGTASYSGDAWGTYFTATTGVDMTGTFSAQVNFNSPSITDFDLKVQNGSYSAEISNATGSFSSSQFTLSGGTWTLSPGGTVSSTQRAGAGSLYGPNGQYIGGAWGMYLNSSQGANGIFQGSQTSGGGGT